MDSQGGWQLVWISFFSEFLGFLIPDAVGSLLRGSKRQGPNGLRGLSNRPHNNLLHSHSPPATLASSLFLRHTTFIPTFLLHTMLLSAWNARPPVSTWYLLSLPSILAQMLLLQGFYPDCSSKYNDLPGFHSPLHLPYTVFQPLLNTCHCLTYDILRCGIYCSSHWNVSATRADRLAVLFTHVPHPRVLGGL